MTLDIEPEVASVPPEPASVLEANPEVEGALAEEAEVMALRYWPPFALRDMATMVTVTIVVVLLAIFLVPRQVVTDPIYRTAAPSPDWLYLFYLLPYMDLRGDWELPALLMFPPAAIFLLALVPFVHPGRPRWVRRWLRNSLAVGGVALILGVVLVATVQAGATVPAQGCEACHRPRMVGGAPVDLQSFGHRESQWIGKHVTDPQYWWMR